MSFQNCLLVWLLFYYIFNCFLKVKFLACSKFVFENTQGKIFHYGHVRDLVKNGTLVT